MRYTERRRPRDDLILVFSIFTREIDLSQPNFLKFAHPKLG